MTTLIVLIPAGFILGALINYLADVLPITRKLSAPKCVYCGGDISWKSYLALRNCPECEKSRLIRAWLLPLLGVGVTIWFWYWPPYYLGFWWSIVLLAYLTLVAIIDIEHHLILHPVSLAGLALGLVMGLARHSFLETLLGGAFGFGVMLALYFLGRVFARVLARRRGQTLEDDEALGFGDVNLSGIIGLIMGWPAIVGGLFLAVILGGVAGGLVLLGGALRGRQNAYMFIPYGPFLVLAIILLLYPAW
ncbi:MAG TPA: A24 family peptidase [Anaerolineaceae bacterium]|nr:A24 family peptidase [Anaerolineaceae bacterium]